LCLTDASHRLVHFLLCDLIIAVYDGTQVMCIIIYESVYRVTSMYVKLLLIIFIGRFFMIVYIVINFSFLSPFCFMYRSANDQSM
jgi:hypothetical protein